jgi:cyclomaltodextrinase
MSNDIEWVPSTVFYQIFPDRFARNADATETDPKLQEWQIDPTPHAYKGGTLDGIVKNGVESGYFSAMGVTGIYTCPIFSSASNHRYHTHDYFQVDPMLGGNEAFLHALQVTKKHGIRWILDGVFNHTSRSFLPFADLLENGKESAYFDWWILDHPHHPKLAPYPCPDQHKHKPGYSCWWGLPALPKLNTNNPDVREYLWNVGEHWMKRGIDGWRLDVPNEINDDSFWLEFRRRVKRVREDAYIVGEIWGDAGRWLQPHHDLDAKREPLFDACMNYPWTRSVLGFVAPRNGGQMLNPGLLTRTGLDNTQLVPSGRDWALMVEKTFPREGNPDAYAWNTILAQFNLLGSHDTPRVTSILTEGDYMHNPAWASLYLAYVLQMTMPGTPCIYYGDEIGLTGLQDPMCRKGMPWPKSFPYPLAGPTWNFLLLKHISLLIHLRNNLLSLQRGAWIRLWADKERCVVYARGLVGQLPIVVVVNAEKSALPLNVDVSRVPGVLAADIDWMDVMSNLQLRTRHGNAKDIFASPPGVLQARMDGLCLDLHIPAETALVLVPRHRFPIELSKSIEEAITRLKQMSE